jgi:hypothetical protein
MDYKWIPVIGAPLLYQEDKLIFKGGTKRDEQGENPDQAFMGMYLCNNTFTGGSITATVEFSAKSPASCCEIILYYDPASQATVNAGIPSFSFPLFTVREWRNNKWNYLASSGDREQALEANKEYEIKVTVNGSLISIFTDGIEIIKTNLPKPIPQSQVGLFFIDHTDIVVKKFEIKNQRPKAFVIMQFTSPFNEVYMEVIQKICDDLKIDVVRIDEVNGPGIILSDISRSILESTLVIADITPLNANVFYEVGYAHGLNKPTILIAEKGTKLPFDVSPFRTLMYENSIAGKPKLEKGLTDYIVTIIKDNNLGSFTG